MDKQHQSCLIKPQGVLLCLSIKIMQNEYVYIYIHIHMTMDLDIYQILKGLY